MDDHNLEPSRAELSAITLLARLSRLKAAGLTPEQAVAKVMQPESADEYAERNRVAMDEAQARLISPEYMGRFAEIEAEPDPAKKAAARAQLMRENFAALDMDAVHRQIAARNRQMVKEGVLPPDALHR